MNVYCCCSRHSKLPLRIARLEAFKFLDGMSQDGKMPLACSEMCTKHLEINSIHI
jgi:hypothetical protein